MAINKLKLKPKLHFSCVFFSFWGPAPSDK